MKYRKLKIAWSVGWGFVCVLLIGLWVDSYRYVNQVLCTINDTYIYAFSPPGTLGVNILEEESVDPWTIYKVPTKEWLASGQALWREHTWGGFYFGSVDGPTAIAPYWFLSLVVAILAAMPWAQRLKRFSLRTLLIAATVVAVGPGLIVWAAKRI